MIARVMSANFQMQPQHTDFNIQFSAAISNTRQQYNLMGYTVDRSQPSAKSLTYYLHIRNNMPVVATFDLHSAVELWLMEKKATTQRWFNAIFENEQTYKVTKKSERHCLSMLTCFIA